MQSASYFNYMVELVRSGAVKESTLDEAVRRILNVKAALGLFDDPYKYCSPEREASGTLTASNKAEARAIAAQSIVLLKNDGGLLPLSPDVKRVAVLVISGSIPSTLPSDMYERILSRLEGKGIRVVVDAQMSGK